ncbi:MAG: DUF6650 family protein [Thermodesulfobacteriota bacterium]
MKRKKNTIKYRNILSRLTGFSTPLFGVQWNPSEPEREIVRRLLTFLEDRRVLYVPRNLEVESEVEHSVLQIREELTKTLQYLSENSNASGSVRAMRTACRKFLTEPYPVFPNTPRRGERDWGPWMHRGEFSDGFFVALGELRSVFGIHIATLSVSYGIDLEEDIASILPAQGED